MPESNLKSVAKAVGASEFSRSARPPLIYAVRRCNGGLCRLWAVSRDFIDRGGICCWFRAVRVSREVAVEVSVFVPVI